MAEEGSLEKTPNAGDGPPTSATPDADAANAVIQAGDSATPGEPTVPDDSSTPPPADSHQGNTPPNTSADSPATPAVPPATPALDRSAEAAIDFTKSMIRLAREKPAVAEVMNEAMGVGSPAGQPQQGYAGTVQNGAAPQGQAEPTPESFMDPGQVYDPHQATIANTPSHKAHQQYFKAYSDWSASKAVREDRARQDQELQAQNLTRRFNEDTVATAREFGDDETGQTAFVAEVGKLLDPYADQREALRILYKGLYSDKLMKIEVDKRLAEIAAGATGNETPHGAPTGLSDPSGPGREKVYHEKASDKAMDDVANA